tara:strand:+ start:344 stop:2035 length:1692 start_codon:yes stop_codon:yes gene_type:complete
MIFNLLKSFFIIVIFLLYQSPSYSKVTDNKEFNQRYLSNYFSALVSYDNQNNKKALKFFNLSKPVLRKHNNYLEEYVFSLIAGGEYSKAVKQVNYWQNHENSNFFEARLILILDSLRKKNFVDASKFINDLKFFKEMGTYELVIYETLKSYIYLFKNKKINKKNNNFGQLSLITNSFQNCYLNSNKTKANFLNLINSKDADYSRYLFFYLSSIVENQQYEIVREISSTIDPIRSSLLVAQTKKWIDKSDFKKFKNYFSCKSETDILAEFFFLIANLHASQENYNQSNFYLNISNFLNPKFYYNLSLLAENYFQSKNYDLARNLLEKFDRDDETYYWYRIKKIGQIIAEKDNDEDSLNFIEKNFNEFEKPSIEILFDMGNIYKRLKKYENSIKLYSNILPKLKQNSEAYADVLYRRGGSFERLGKYEEADNDLLKSLEISPGDPYVANYLAYSWLERKYKINIAIKMLDEAYKQKKDDPYIIDSVGWGYYLIGDYINAEKYLKLALQLMPDDPIVNDHYGDTLWMLDQKLQAKYFWKNVLNLEETEEEMKNKIKQKLLFGPDKT